MEAPRVSLTPAVFPREVSCYSDKEVRESTSCVLCLSIQLEIVRYVRESEAVRCTDIGSYEYVGRLLELVSRKRHHDASFFLHFGRFVE